MLNFFNKQTDIKQKELSEEEADKLNWIVSYFGNIINENLMQHSPFNITGAKVMRLDLDMNDINKLYLRDVQKRINSAVTNEYYEKAAKLKKILDADLTKK